MRKSHPRNPSPGWPYDRSHRVQMDLPSHRLSHRHTRHIQSPIKTSFFVLKHLYFSSLKCIVPGGHVPLKMVGVLLAPGEYCMQKKIGLHG